MTVRLLGTGGADGIPNPYCDCAVCSRARVERGREIRTRSAALVDDTIKVDLCPETSWQLLRDGLTALDWSALVFTHSDPDHFALDELQYCLFPFVSRDMAPFPIYANDTICCHIEAKYPAWPFELHRTVSFEPVTIGEYRLVPVRANHTPSEDAHNLVFQRDGKTFLYATDTGWWHESTWEFLREFRLDLLVIECSEGLTGTDYYGHLSVKELIEVVDRLRGQGTLDEESRVVTTHHAHTGGATYEKLVEVLEPLGIAVGYDGLVLEV